MLCGAGFHFTTLALSSVTHLKVRRRLGDMIKRERFFSLSPSASRHSPREGNARSFSNISISASPCARTARPESQADARTLQIRCVNIAYVNDPSAGSPTETLLRLLLPLNDQVWSSSRHNRQRLTALPRTSPKTSLNHSIGSSDGRCVQRAGT